MFLIFSIILNYFYTSTYDRLSVCPWSVLVIKYGISYLSLPATPFNNEATVCALSLTNPKIFWKKLF